MNEQLNEDTWFFESCFGVYFIVDHNNGREREEKDVDLYLD